MSQHIWKFFFETDVSGYTLIVPSVAVGNVGQLACDLLISSLNMTRAATVHSPAFIPVLGHDPYDVNRFSLSGSCDLYQCDAKKLLVLQIRAPLVYQYAKSFLSDIVQRFQDKSVKDIVILTSSFAHEKRHIQTTPFRYIANDLCVHKSKLAELKWKEHDQLDETRILGGGFASMLFETCVEKSVPCLVLYKYSSEGDNIPDAYDMIQQLTDIMPLFNNDNLVTQLHPPASWKLLFGKPPEDGIY